MDTIKDYLESLFLGIPESEKSQQLKEDLLANMEDRYSDLLEEGKGEHEAIGITIAEFGSLDELLDELGLVKEPESNPEEADWGESITEDEAFDYLKNYRKCAVGIATGVMLCIIGVAAMIFLANAFYSEIGFFLMMVMIAIAVGFFINYGLALSAAGKKLNDRLISDGVGKTIWQIKEDFQRSFNLCMVLGVGLCVISVGMLFFGEAFFHRASFGVSMMLATSAFGVFLLIYGGMVHSSFEKFTKGKVFVSDEDELGPRARREKYGDAHSIMGTFESFYWPVVVCIFLVWSFLFHGWAISWIVFPIAGIFQEGLKNIFAARNR